MTVPTPTAPRPRRLAIILGAMKSGTTSLFEHLAQHPAVAASEPKEPTYFTPPPRGAAPRDDAWYFARWAFDPSRHEVALEASTFYSKYPRRGDAIAGLERFIAEHGVDVRFLYMMRHPIERIESHFRHLAQFEPRRLLRNRPRELAHALDVSSYATQLGRWGARFARDRFLLLSFDELRTAPEAVVRRACSHLGIDPSHPFSRLDEPRHVSLRRAPLVTALARSPLIGHVWRRLPLSVRNVGKRLLARYGERHRPFLTPAERRAAALRLRPELDRLALDWGFDVSSWSLD